MFYFQPVLLRVAQGCNLRSGVHLEIATKGVPQSERSSVVWGWCQCTQGCGMFSGTAEKLMRPPCRSREFVSGKPSHVTRKG